MGLKFGKTHLATVALLALDWLEPVMTQHVRSRDVTALQPRRRPSAIA
jgi:hypothetical protein